MLKKSLSILLVLIILAVIVAIVWLAVMPEKGDSFTEFYLLGLNGKADSYPKALNIGDTGVVKVGIVNREHVDISYNLLVKIEGEVIQKIEPIKLANGQKWEQQVSFAPLNSGDNQKVEFLLYKNGLVNPYLSLNLWVDVK
ncbi:MAG: DUF1616 domain-containing protein [Dehalococcoidia bacterium]